MIKVAFLGTPDTAVPSLRTLAEMAEVRLVVTRPDRPRGRGRKVAPSPVKAVAVEMGFPVVEAAGSADLPVLIEALENAKVDIGVVAAFGMILPPQVLDIPWAGMVNLHFSLLPRWRGATPVERAILAGDTRTGVSLMKMQEGLDTGPVFCAWETDIKPDETGGTLSSRLAEGAAHLLESSLSQVVYGELTAQPQQEANATYAFRIKPAETQLDFSFSAEYLTRKVRAFNPRPGARFVWREKVFKILSATVFEGGLSQLLEPGELHRVADQVFVGCAQGCIKLLVVQPQGRKPMDAVDWVRGVKGELGGFQ